MPTAALGQVESAATKVIPRLAKRETSGCSLAASFVRAHLTGRCPGRKDIPGQGLRGAAFLTKMSLQWRGQK